MNLFSTQKNYWMDRPTNHSHTPPTRPTSNSNAPHSRQRGRGRHDHDARPGGLARRAGAYVVYLCIPHTTRMPHACRPPIHRPKTKPTKPRTPTETPKQVRAFSDETLTCALYQLSHPRPGLDSAVELLATFTHTALNPRGHVDAALYLNERVLQLPRRPVAFSYACRSQSALRLLLEELLWEPTARYWLVLRRLPANNTATTTTTKDDDDEASAGSHTWPPAPRIPVPHPDFGFPQGNAVNTGYVARHRLLHELAPLFPAREGCFVKILYQVCGMLLV